MYKPVITPKTANITVVENTNLGVNSYEMDELWSPDTDIWKSKVLDVGSPKYNTNSTYWFDRSRYRNHGTITGAVWKQLASGAWVLSMDGTDDYAELDDGSVASQLNFTSGDFTLLFCGSAPNLSGIQVIYQRGAYNTDGFYWMITSGGEMDVYTNQSGASQRNLSSSGYVDDKVRLYTVVRKGTAITFYRDAQEVPKSVTTAITDPASCARTAKLGIHDDKSQRGWNGLYIFFKAFSMALSQPEIEQIYHSIIWRYR